jgi:proline dehydrogenase
MIRRSLLYLSQSPGARKVLTGNPLTRPMSRRFVAGEGADDLMDSVREVNGKGFQATANYLGEAVRDRESARAAADMYLTVIDHLSDEGLDAGVSLKFTQMGQDIDEAFLQENLGRVLQRAKDAGVFIRFDMEGSDYTQRTLDAFEALWQEGWRGIGAVLQAYLKRTAGDVRRMIDLGAPVRLCKGAYAEPAAIAYQEMDRIRANFIELMHWLMAEGEDPAIATHDPILIDAARGFAAREGIDAARFEFQLLYGVRRDIQQELLDAGHRVRVYIPFGEMWYPYLMRRLAERPENLFLVMGSVVKESPLGFLWQTPREGDRAEGSGDGTGGAGGQVP